MHIPGFFYVYIFYSMALFIAALIFERNPSAYSKYVAVKVWL